MGFHLPVLIAIVTQDPKSSPRWSRRMFIINNKITKYNVHNYITPPWWAAGAEIKVPSGENTELKRSPFKALSKSVYSHTCYAYCQGFLPCLFVPFRSIHLHFFPNTSPDFFLCWLWLTPGSCVGPQNKIGHPAECTVPCWVAAEYK